MSLKGKLNAPRRLTKLSLEHMVLASISLCTYILHSLLRISEHVQFYKHYCSCYECPFLTILKIIYIFLPPAPLSSCMLLSIVKAHVPKGAPGLLV